MIEPTQPEYEQIGERMLTRLRGRERRRRGVQLFAVGLAAAAITATSIVGGGVLQFVPGEGRGASTEIVAGGALSSDSGVEHEFAVTCHAGMGAVSGSVSIVRIGHVDPPDVHQAATECSRLWQSGVFGDLTGGVLLQRSEGAEAAESVTPSSGAQSLAPPLQPCLLPDGSISVWPDVELQGRTLCKHHGSAGSGD